MKKWFGIPIGIISTFLILFGIALYLYPNDSRVESIEFVGSEKEYGLVTRLFDSNYSFDIDEPEYKYALQDLKAYDAIKQVNVKSARLKKPFQTYFSIGRYPQRLAGFDGIFLPSGTALSVSLEEGVDAVSFKGVGVGNVAKVTVESDSKSHSSMLKKLYSGPSELTTFQKVFSPDTEFEALALDSVVLPGLDGAKIFTIRCDQPCIISEPRFLKRSEKPRNNTLVLMIDTMRYNALDFGDAPHLDAIRKDSINFQKAIAPGNMTSPSTNAMLSCQGPSDIGKLAFSYGVKLEERERYYRREKPSWPSYLRSEGYRTAMIGNVSVLSEVMGIGIDHGFSEQVAVEPNDHETALTAREVRRFLAKDAEQPFLLYVHFNAPHAPYKAPLKDLLATFPGVQALQNYPSILRWIYRAEIRFVDRYVGEIVQALKKQGLFDRTNIVVLSDHGDHHTPRQFPGNLAGPEKVGSFFDHGATLLNDEIRVPFFIRVPEHGSMAIDKWVSTIDLGPTLLNLEKIPVPEYCRGRSLMTHAGDDVQPLASEGFRGRAIIFDNRYKYIRTYAPTRKRFYTPDSWSGVKTSFLVPEQLYDLKSDLWESHNLIDEPRAASAILTKARAVFEQYYRDGYRYELVLESKGEFTYEFNVLKKVSGKSKNRVVLKIEDLESLPKTVLINSKSVPIKATQMRLPITVAPSDLPSELPGDHSLLPPERKPNAYIRKVLKTNIRARRVVAANPEFEKVLREWGYLNDN